jgi:hypothetical protein
MVKVEVQVGLQELGLKLQLAPVGNPEQERLTLGKLFPIKVKVTVVIMEFPLKTVPSLGKTEIEKSLKVTVV